MGVLDKVRNYWGKRGTKKKADKLALQLERQEAEGVARKKWAKREAIRQAEERYKPKPNIFERIDTKFNLGKPSGKGVAVKGYRQVEQRPIYQKPRKKKKKRMVGKLYEDEEDLIPLW